MFKKYLIIIIFFIGVSCFVVGADFALAGSGDNVSGWAWSENIGWISFNGDNYAGGADYGVNIDLSTGLMSGYAWSENIGWITFNSSQLSGCSSGTCEARFNLSTKKITGWARAYRAIAPEGQSLGGWDGWIKLGPGSGSWTNDVRIDTSVPGPPYEFYGWGSSSADPSTGVVGWVSFNGDNYAGGADYQVKLNASINQPPTASGLNTSGINYCTVPTQRFSWIYSDPDGDPESRFQFQVDDKSNFADCNAGTNCEVNRDFSGLSNPSPTTNEQQVSIAVSPGTNQLGYNTTYYWRVKVYDNQGKDSGWVDGLSFNTEAHRWPKCDFEWLPLSPSAKEDVQFTDKSVCRGLGDVVVPCASWKWTMPSVTYVSGTDTTQNPIVQFLTNLTGATIKLEVRDPDGNTCPCTRSINVNLPLPKWKEVTPR